MTPSCTECAKFPCQARANLGSLLETIKDVIWSADVEPFRITFVNSATLSVYGHAPGAFLQNSDLWLECVHPDDRWKMEKSFGILLTAHYTENEYRIIAADGTLKWVLDRVWLVRNEDGTPCGLKGICTDITRRRRTEDELRRSEERYKSLANNLDALVTQRTLELREANENLQSLLHERQRHVARVEDINITLTNVLEKMKEQEHVILQKLNCRINNNIFPLLTKLHRHTDTPELLSLLEDELYALTDRKKRNFSLGDFSQKLSASELRVLKFAKDGKSARDIASALTISVFTVNNHLRSIRRKLGLTNAKIQLKSYLANIEVDSIPLEEESTGLRLQTAHS